MGKTAFIFPGQGSQYVGMGKDFYEKFPAARDIFDKASEASGLDVAALCFEENEQIHITEYTQIAMLTVEVALLKVLEEMGYRPDVAAGLSLGEYAALAAADVMDVKDLFYCVRKRGIFMQEAVPTGGAMTAILGLDSETIAKACEETEGIVSVANYNCPGQTVITGEAGAVTAASERLKELGAKRCVPLKVSGPFHSPYAERRRGEAGSGACRYQPEGNPRSLSFQCDRRLRCRYITGKGTSCKTGFQFCKMAGVCGTYDSGRRRYLCGDWSRKIPFRFYAQNKPGCDCDKCGKGRGSGEASPDRKGVRV